MESLKKIEVMKNMLMIIMIIIVSACTKKIIPPAEGVEPVGSEKALRGQVAFIQRCNRCHPDGMAGLGPSIINKPLPGFLIKLQVREGFGAMPSFKSKSLPGKELDDIVSYIKELRSGSGRSAGK